MKHKFAILFLLCASLGWSQGGNPITAPTAAFDNVTFPIYTLNAVPVPGASLQLIGAPGQATWCYWAVANFQIGSVLSQLGCVNNAPNTLSGSNYVVINPWSYPSAVSTVDVLATPTNQAPTGACNCAVATGLTVGGTNQQSNSLNPYTVSIVSPAAFQLCMRNEVVGSASAHLLLRNCSTGSLVNDLSTTGTGGTVTGTGTANSIPIWTSPSVLGNSPITYNGTNRLTSAAALSINPGPSNTNALNLNTTYTAGQCGGSGSVFSMAPNCRTAQMATHFAADTVGNVSSAYVSVDQGNTTITGTPASSALQGSNYFDISGGTQPWAVGLVGISGVEAVGTVSNFGGVYGQAALGDNPANGATVTLGFGVAGQITNPSGAPTQPLAAALVAYSPVVGAQVTSLGGLLIQDQTAGGASNPSPFGILELGAAPNTFGGNVKAPSFSTSSNCAVNSASPAACGSAATGAVVVPTTTTTYTINTTAVTAHSRIQVTWLSFASDLPSSPTCVAPSATSEPTVSNVVAGTSFTIALASTTGQTCPQFTITD